MPNHNLWYHLFTDENKRLAPVVSFTGWIDDETGHYYVPTEHILHFIVTQHAFDLSVQTLRSGPILPISIRIDFENQLITGDMFTYYWETESREVEHA